MLQEKDIIAVQDNAQKALSLPVGEKVNSILGNQEIDYDTFLDSANKNFEVLFEGFPKNFIVGDISLPGKGNFRTHRENNILFIDNIEAVGYGKKVLFYIIALAINENITSIELKAEPKGDISKRKSLEKLVGFYSSFGFQKVHELNNGVKMKLLLQKGNLLSLVGKLDNYIHSKE